jgi:hypothetical protein
MLKINQVKLEKSFDKIKYLLHRLKMNHLFFSLKFMIRKRVFPVKNLILTFLEAYSHKYN